MKSDWARWHGWLQATAVLCAPVVAMPVALSLSASFAAPLYAQAAPVPGSGPATAPGPAPAPAPAAPAAPPGAPPPGAPLAAPAPAAAPEPTLEQRVQASLNQDEAVLRDVRRSQSDRDAAARRLVLARQSPAADERVFNALNGNHPLVVQAIGKAVADDPTPDERLIPRFVAQLGRVDRATTEAAAMALASYREHRIALPALLQFARTPVAADVAPQRAAAVRALGAVPAQHVAGQLMDLLLNDREEMIRDAAADGLVLMTGIRENGRDAAAWRRWWDANDGRAPDPKSPLQFKAALVDRRPRAGAALSDLDAVVRELYRLAAPAAKPDALARVLNSPDAAIRAAGVRLIRAEVENARVPQGTHPRLSEMISDSSAEVRTEVARTLALINHLESQDRLIVQLAQEPDAAVRLAIMEALVPMADARAAAVPVLLNLLDDPSLRVATAAAETLAKMGGFIRPNPALRGKVVADLQRAMNARGNQDGADDFRGACIEALVPLADRPDPVLGPLFFRLLNPAEKERVRKAALQGIGVAGDNRFANQVMAFIRDEKSEKVKVVGFQAMGQIGAFANSGQILEFTQVAREPTKSVNDAAWEAFVQLLPKASRQALGELKDVQFKGQPARRLPVLQELARRQKESNDPLEQRELAATHEDIGATYMKLEEPQPREAIRYFRQALDFWLTQPGVQPMVLEGLINNFMDALLASRQYADAKKLAEQVLSRDDKYQTVVGPRIVKLADSLVEEKKRGEALLMIEEMQRMNPPLKEPFAGRLAQAKTAAEKLPAAPPAQ